MRKMLLGISAGAALMLAAGVQASILGPFTMKSEGVTTQSGLDLDYAGLVTDQPAAFGFVTHTASLTIDPMDSTISGTFSFTGVNGDLFMDVAGSLFDIGGPFATTAGTFSVTGGTGDFAGIIGSGVFNSFTDTDNGDTEVRLGGVLIPAPGSAALLALAGLAAARRRR